MWWPRALVAVVLASAGVTVLPAVAGAATISESFSPPSIPLNDTATLTFTIDNPDASTHSVIFDDTLPSGVQVAGTPTTTCTGPQAMASSGGPSDLAFNDVALTDANCTVSATLRGGQAGAWQNDVSALLDGNPTPVTASVDVVAPPSISAAFGATLVGLDGTTPLTFTITNPNPAFAMSGIAFTDALPSGLVISGQPGAGNTCAGTLTAAAGTDSLGLSGGQLAPGATCTVSAVTAATATGTFTDTSTQVSSAEGGIGNTASAGLTVIGAPTVTLSAPASGRVYAFGQKVRAAFSCADDPRGPGIEACRGTTASGSLIATGTAGTHSFTVTAISGDGGVASDTVFYSVAPDNRFTVAKPRAHADGSIDLTVKVPGPGRVLARSALGHAVASTRRAGKLHLTIRPTARGRQAIQAEHPLHVTVTLSYTPKGGTPRTARLTVVA